MYLERIIKKTLFRNIKFDWLKFPPIGLIILFLYVLNPGHGKKKSQLIILIFFHFIQVIKMSHTNQHVKLDEVWAKILDGINHVYQVQSMKKATYMLLYS